MDRVESEWSYKAQMDSVKIALAIRAARGIVGISQGGLAEGTGVPRVTLARLETLRGNLRADQFLVLLDFFKKLGVSIELSRDPGFVIRVDQTFVEREASNEELMNSEIPDPTHSPDATRGNRRTIVKSTGNEPQK